MKEKRTSKTSRPVQPLAEVFGHLIDNRSAKGTRYRSNRLCPFNNKVPNCTKDKAKDPLGVCSIFHESDPVITCPIRFREDWLITDDAASFFFKDTASWSSLTEVRLNDVHGKSAGNIDVVLVAYDDKGKIFDFGALEVQAVYISGNVREPFAYYMKNPRIHAQMDWSTQPNYPRPDYLSSSRKRLAPQLMFKGGILHSWGKKIAVALDKNFFQTLPKFKGVSKSNAQIAWLVYELALVNNNGHESFSLKKLIKFIRNLSRHFCRSRHRPQGTFTISYSCFRKNLMGNLKCLPLPRSLKNLSNKIWLPLGNKHYSRI